MKYRLTPRAVEIIEKMIYYIALDKPRAAEGVYERMLETFELIAERPHIGKEVEYFGDPNIRYKSVIKHKDYLVFYRIRHKEIVISLVVRAERILPNYLDEI